MVAHRIEWLVENHVVLTTIFSWDANSLAQMMSDINELVNQSDLPLVHTIWDLKGIERYSTHLNEIRQAIKTLFSNEQLGWVVTIIDNRMVGFLAHAGASMYRARYRSFKTI